MDFTHRMFGLLFCMLTFDRITCFVDLRASPVWPSGSYALPMSKTGCPEGNMFTWYTGLRIEELEINQNRNRQSTSINLMSKIEKPYIKRYFCVKNDTETDETRPKWPDGTYCIYKKGYFCPQGFREGFVLWDDNNGKNGSNGNSRIGELPEGVYNQDTLIYFCCKKTGSVMKRISLPVNMPFYLLAFESATCQEVQGAIYSLEYIIFDTEDTDNQDTSFYPYPYATDRRDPVIYYCYYRECKWNFSQLNGAFSSPYFPDNYHDYQDCQWNITVPRGHVIRLKFDMFELESSPLSCGGSRCSCDYVEVKQQSVLGDVIVLGKYCMKATPPNIIESSTNMLIVTFHSDHAISAKGFNASYTTIASFADRNATTPGATSSAIKSMRSSSKGWTSSGTTENGTDELAPTRHTTHGTVRNNLTATQGLMSRTIKRSLNKSSFTPSDPSKLSKDIITRNSYGAPIRVKQGLTPKKPTTKSKIGQVSHHYVAGNSSEVSKPSPRNIIGLPFKYFLVVAICLVVLVLGIFSYLVLKLCKRRGRSCMKGFDQSNPFHSVTYSSVTRSSDSTVPTSPTSPIKIYAASELEEFFLENKLIDNPIYNKRCPKNNCSVLDNSKVEESLCASPLCERSGLLMDHIQFTINNPLYQSYEGSNDKESRTENPLYE